MSRTKRVALTVVWTFYSVVLLNSWFGPLRLTPSALNYPFVLAVLCLPFLRTPLTRGKRLMDFVSADGGRAFTQANVVLITLIAVPIALCGLYEVTTGRSLLPTSYEDIRRFKYNGHTYHVVYFSWGATDDGGVRVTRETPVLPGVVYVSSVYSESGSRDVEIVRSDTSGFWIRGSGSRSEPEFVPDSASKVR